MKQFLRASVQTTSIHTWKHHGIKLLFMLLSLVAMPANGKLNRRLFNVLFESAATKSWVTMQLNLDQNIVDTQTNLIWFLTSPSSVTAGDCLILNIPNPYDKEPHYKPFTAFDDVLKVPVPTACSWTSSNTAKCEIISANQLKMTFTATSSSNKLTGQTTQQPFSTPFSSIRIPNITFKYYSGCNMTTGLTVQGNSISLSQVNPQTIDSAKISFTSLSDIVADTNASLLIKFKPVTTFHQEGQILIKVPGWYMLQRATALEPELYSTESMVEKASIVTFPNGDFKVTEKPSFSQATRSLTVKYTGLADSTNEIVIRIDGFKNPVNKRPKKGFQLSTLDAEENLISTCDPEQPLIVNLTKVAEGGRQMSMLGDANGNNIGRIGTYQQIELNFQSTIPFEPDCWFRFSFPSLLKLDEYLTYIVGSDIFSRVDGSNFITVGNGMTVYLEDKNQVVVQACANPDALQTDLPFGSVKFSLIKLPDYLIAINPLVIEAFSDQDLTELVLKQDANDDSAFNQETLKPGLMTLTSFTASSDLALARDVSYKILFTPSHTSTSNTRIIIQMPNKLKFDPKNGCKTEGLVAKCLIDTNTNIITLTNAFTQDFAGGKQLIVTIQSATNPSGAMEAGPWSVTTENQFNGQYYKVDSESSATSFYAKPGQIISTLVQDEYSTYKPSQLSFKFKLDHSVPKGGKLSVIFPNQIRFINFDSQSDPVSAFLQSKSPGLENAQLTMQSVIFDLPNGWTNATLPIGLTLNSVLMPRSFKPSSAFNVTTLNEEGYILDAGGGDITLNMQQMTPFNSIEILPTNHTNGGIAPYRVRVDSSVQLKGSDLLTIILPPGLTIPDKVRCNALSPPVGVKSLLCTFVGQKIQVTFAELVDGLYALGKFEFEIVGIKNPPSFEPTQSFSSVYFQTADYYNMTCAGPEQLEKLKITNTEVALMQWHNITQTTEEFGGVGSSEITVLMYNSMHEHGLVKLTLTNQIKLFPETECEVTTYKKFGRETCIIDLDRQTITAKNVFQQGYLGKITISISKLQNPVDNRNLLEMMIETFDSDKLYPEDKLMFKPKLRCEYPCLNCGATPTTCTSCWADDPNPFLMIDTSKALCQAACDNGWTSNGDPAKICQRCEPSCETCVERGQVGDRSLCLTCGADFNFFVPTDYSCEGTSCTGSCKIECPVGLYNGGNGVCLPCDPSCRTCSNSANKCTSCQMNSALSKLTDNKCLASCPEGFGEKAGTCFQCMSPCKTCGTEPTICQSCDGTDGLKYNFGPTCVQECPEGFDADTDAMKCVGCNKGCQICDEANDYYCSKCNFPLKLLKGKCYSSCPKLYISNFAGDECLSLGLQDIKIVYFPWLCMTVIAFGISMVGKITKETNKGEKVKAVHLLIPSFHMMMGIIENLSILTQIVMTFKFGTYRFALPVLAAYITYILGNILFTVFFMKTFSGQFTVMENGKPVLEQAYVEDLDENGKLQKNQNGRTKKKPEERLKKKARDFEYWNWEKQPANKFAKLIVYIGGTGVSWKLYKLLYAHFWGFNIKDASFSKPKEYKSLQLKMLIFNSVFTYAILVPISIAGLVDFDWGTQLQICFVENTVIPFIMIALGYWEYRKCNYPASKMKGHAELQALNEDEALYSKIGNRSKTFLLKELKSNSEFTSKKFDELIAQFKGREALSCIGFGNPREEDPRRVHTWPLQVDSDIEVDDPPQPLPDFYPDNCYADGLTAEQLFMIKYLQRNLKQKNIQAEHGYSADQAIRQDAELIANERKLIMNKGDDDEEHQADHKKHRGRKNRFFKQIDNEDNDAGALLDSDDEGNKKAKRAMEAEFKKKKQLASAKEEEAKEAARLEMEMKKQEKKLKAMKLTEENLRLKEQLEKQRKDQDREEQEFKRRLAEEEARVKSIQETIEQKNREQEAKRIQLEEEMKKKQQQQQEELNQMLEQNRLRLTNETDEQLDKLNLGLMQETQRDAAPIETAIQVTPVKPPVVENKIESQKDISAAVESPQKTLTKDATKQSAAGVVKPKQSPVSSKKSLKPKNENAKLGKTAQNQKSFREVQQKKSEPAVNAQKSEKSTSRSRLNGQTSDRALNKKSLESLGKSGAPASVKALSSSPVKVQDQRSERVVPIVKSGSDISASQMAVTADQKLKPDNDRSTVNDANSNNRAAHLSVMQTDENSFIDANVTNQMFYEPDVDYRKFNEIDILGELDRDDRGNVLLFLDEATSKSVYVDAKYRPINAFGYLVDKSGDVINGTGKKVFDRRDLDERGNIPMPYALEKYNFNPFDLQGDYKYKDVNDPLSFQRTVEKQEDGTEVEFDSQKRVINAQGFLIDGNGSLLDRKGSVRFDWRQFASYGGLIPKLYNLQGKTFEIHEVMGVFDREKSDAIKFNRGKDATGRDVAVDKAGYMVNSKGYIINKEGSICTRQGKILFTANQLKNGEFPKIFPFTRFNINRVLGDFDLLSNGHPALIKKNGNYYDKQGRQVNQKGYFVDSNGNVIDVCKKFSFDKKVLDPSGDIPEVFQINLLRSDSQSSLSRLMSEIDREQQVFEESRVKTKQAKRQLGNQSDTSFESMMEDSPSKYDTQNQRFSHVSAPDGKFAIAAKWMDKMPEDIEEESDADAEAGEVGPFKKAKKKKRVPIGGQYIVQDITERDVQLASAYGGEARPRIRKPGQRFATVQRGGGTADQRSNILTPSQPLSKERGPKINIQTSGKDMLISGGVQIAGLASAKESARKVHNETTAVGIGRLVGTQQRNRSRGNARGDQGPQPTTSNWNEQHGRTLEDEKAFEKEKRTVSQDPRLPKKRKQKNNRKEVDHNRSKHANPEQNRAFEEEFEQLYKKDIDKFIDGSDFEVESLGFSDLSKGTFKSVARDPKMRDLEKVYLQRIEFQQLNQTHGMHEFAKRSKNKVPVRPLLHQFIDDPREIMRGEYPKFQTGPVTSITKQSPRQNEKSGSKSPRRLANADLQKSQDSLNGDVSRSNKKRSIPQTEQ